MEPPRAPTHPVSTMTFRPFVLLALLAAPVAAQTPDAEKAAVLATVQKVWDAMRTKDTLLLKSAFDTSGRLLSITAGPTPSIRQTTPSQFGAAFSRAAAGSEWIERMYDPEVRIDGNVAQVWTYYTFHQGTTFRHCGYDAFMLLKVGGVWKITQIADTQRTTGCTRTSG
jgi:hypothetical protein